MANIQHCMNCSNQEVEIHQGTICKVTGRKPEFEKKCFNFSMGDGVRNNYKLLIAEYENEKMKRPLIVSYVVVISIIGILVVLLGTYFFELIDNGRYINYISTIQITISGIGAYLLTTSINKFFHHNKGFKQKKLQLRSFENMLITYGISYDYQILHAEKYHNKREFKLKYRIGLIEQQDKIVINE